MLRQVVPVYKVHCVQLGVLKQDESDLEMELLLLFELVLERVERVVVVVVHQPSFDGFLWGYFWLDFLLVYNVSVLEAVFDVAEELIRFVCFYLLDL